MKQILFALGLAIFFIYLLLFPAECSSATQYGIVLWINHVIPSLFPMMILSNILTESNTAWYLVRPLESVIAPLFSISPYGIYVMVVGFLCGYPMGCKTISDLYQKDLLSLEESQDLAVFCNNASPSFLLSYVLSQHFPSFPVIPFLFIVYGTPLFYGMVIRKRHLGTNRLFTKKRSTESAMPVLTFHNSMIEHSIMKSMQSIAKIGGYLIPFTIICSIFKKIPYFSYIKYIGTGMLELTNGISYLATDSSIPTSYMFCIVIFLTSFGGLCSAYQSKELLQSFQMPLSNYLKHKLKISSIAVTIAFFIAKHYYP